VTRARKDGSAEKIAAAIQRERAASGAADRILAECNAGMRLITRAGLDSLKEYNQQMSEAWDARAAVTGALARHRGGPR